MNETEVAELKDKIKNFRDKSLEYDNQAYELEIKLASHLREELLEALPRLKWVAEGNFFEKGIIFFLKAKISTYNFSEIRKLSGNWHHHTEVFKQFRVIQSDDELLLYPQPETNLETLVKVVKEQGLTVDYKNLQKLKKNLEHSLRILEIIK